MSADANGWMPIETAPKDSRIDIWLFLGDGEGMRVTDATMLSNGSIKLWRGHFDDGTGEWITYNPAAHGETVTHWRPLPKPPVQSESSQ